MDTYHSQVEHHNGVHTLQHWGKPLAGLLRCSCVDAPLQLVDWVPLEAIGSAYTDWALANGGLPALVSLVHPRPIRWNTVLEATDAKLGYKLPRIPLAGWETKLRERSISPSVMDFANLVSRVNSFRATGSDRHMLARVKVARTLRQPSRRRQGEPIGSDLPD